MIAQSRLAVVRSLRDFLDLIRFSHTLFALPFALLAAVLAWQDEPFRWLDLVGILLCMVFARSAAMAFNRLVDRRIDSQNPRTSTRHLPAGRMSTKIVWCFTAICCLGFLASTALFELRDPANPWPLIFGLPVLAFVLGYSYAKRFTSLVHFWLGAALMLAPIAAWIAVRGLVEMLVPLQLGLAVMFWVAGFDMLYACQDAAIDRSQGLFSLPARFGIVASLRIAAVCHFIMFAVLFTLNLTSPHLGLVYLIGLGIIGLLLIYEHSLVKPDQLSRVNVAFFQVNAIISIGLFLLVLIQVAINDLL